MEWLKFVYFYRPNQPMFQELLTLHYSYFNEFLCWEWTSSPFKIRNIPNKNPHLVHLKYKTNRIKIRAPIRWNRWHFEHRNDFRIICIFFFKQCLVTNQGWIYSSPQAFSCEILFFRALAVCGESILTPLNERRYFQLIKSMIFMVFWLPSALV